MKNSLNDSFSRSENTRVLLMQLVMIRQKRRSPAKRKLSVSSFNFSSWPTSDEQYFRSPATAKSSQGGAENRFGNIVGSATSLKLGESALIPLARKLSFFDRSIARYVVVYINNRRHCARRDVKYISVGFIATHNFPTCNIGRRQQCCFHCNFQYRGVSTNINAPRYFTLKKPERSPLFSVNDHLNSTLHVTAEEKPRVP